MKNTTGTEEKETTLEETRAETVPIAKPVTSRIPDHSRATARIFIEGLSALCLNGEDNSVEIAFVSEHHTAVRIGVYKNGCAPVWLHECDQSQKTKIEIKKSSPSGMGEFYQDVKKYNEDFEWMPDLVSPDWHNGADIGIQATAKDHLSAKLVLKDAAFYTRVNCVHDAEQTNLNTGATRLLPNLGRVIGANIICDAADTEILITLTTKDAGGNNVVDNHPFSKGGGPYFIIVGTKPLMESTHLHLLYDHILTLPAGEPRFDLRYASPEGDFNYCGVSEMMTDKASSSAEVFAERSDAVESSDKTAKEGSMLPPGNRRMTSTEFACQVFGGGSGPLPVFP